MTPVTESIIVQPHTRVVGKALAKFVLDVREAVKKGGLEAALEIAKAALNDLVPIVGDLSYVAGEASENVEAEANSVYLTGRDIYKALVS
jgi:hypothetical protein